MILQSLVSYYEALLQRGEIARPGWASVRVQYALKIDENGRLLSVLPLESVGEKGKPVPRYFEGMPAPVKRTVGIESNFLYDNAAYFLGIDAKGKPERARKCFEAARELHVSLLSGSSDPFAAAVCAFFERWQPQQASNNPMFEPLLGAFAAGANLTFSFNARMPNQSEAFVPIWQTHYNGAADGEGKMMRCLVTGQESIPEETHPSVKRVNGAQSSGAALVSFNAPAFCSYGKEQNLNAPVSKYAAFAYTTALNHLLADRAHVKLVGDTTVVFWADGGEPQYQDACGCFIDGESVTDNDLLGVMKALAAGQNAEWDTLPLDPENGFYVLGLSPNAARISVRFFLRDTFGSFAEHIRAHNERLAIVRPAFDREECLPLWRLLRETVNPNARDKSALPQMAGDTLRAILTGARYPATLYQQTMLRIRAERDITRGKAAIVKAYLIRNGTNDQIKEAASMALNEQSNSVPYLLGRLFSVLENIQTSAGGASTVKDRYFNSACSTPASVFPLLLKLKNSHAKVLKRDKPGLYINLERQLTGIMGRLPDRFPAHLTLDEQGAFILGYYHETQKRYEKKNTEENREENEHV